MAFRLDRRISLFWWKKGNRKWIQFGCSESRIHKHFHLSHVFQRKWLPHYGCLGDYVFLHGVLLRLLDSSYIQKGIWLRLDIIILRIINLHKSQVECLLRSLSMGVFHSILWNQHWNYDLWALMLLSKPSRGTYYFLQHPSCSSRIKLNRISFSTHN